MFNFFKKGPEKEISKVEKFMFQSYICMSKNNVDESIILWTKSFLILTRLHIEYPKNLLILNKIIEITNKIVDFYSLDINNLSVVKDFLKNHKVLILDTFEKSLTNEILNKFYLNEITEYNKMNKDAINSNLMNEVNEEAWPKNNKIEIIKQRCRYCISIKNFEKAKEDAQKIIDSYMNKAILEDELMNYVDITIEIGNLFFNFGEFSIAMDYYSKHDKYIQVIGYMKHKLEKSNSNKQTIRFNLSYLFESKIKILICLNNLKKTNSFENVIKEIGNNNDLNLFDKDYDPTLLFPLQQFVIGILYFNLKKYNLAQKHFNNCIRYSNIDKLKDYDFDTEENIQLIEYLNNNINSIIDELGNPIIRNYVMVEIPKNLLNNDDLVDDSIEDEFLEQEPLITSLKNIENEKF